MFEDFCSEICDDTAVPSTAPDAAAGQGPIVPTAPETPIESTSIVTLTEGFHSPDLVCEKFVRDTCGCLKADGKPCSSLFSMEHYFELRAQASFLTHDDLDLVLMGSIMSTILTDDVAWCRHKPAKRSRIRQLYMHNGHTICKTTFMFLYGVGKKRLLAVKDSYNNNGLETRIHKNRRAFPTTTNHLKSSKILWHFYKTIAKKMQYCYQDAFQGLNVMTSKYFHQARVKRYSTIMNIVIHFHLPF